MGAVPFLCGEKGQVREGDVLQKVRENDGKEGFGRNLWKNDQREAVQILLLL